MRSAKSIQEGLDLLARESTKEAQQVSIAEAYARGLRVDKAVAYLDSLIFKKPSYALKLKKAEILYESRRNLEALAAVDDCIETNATGYDAYYMKGWIAWDMMDWKTAAEAFEEALASKDDGIRMTSSDAIAMLADMDRAKNE